MHPDCSLDYTTWFHCAGGYVDLYATPVHTILTAEPLTALITVAILVVRARGVFFARSPLRRVQLRMRWGKDPLWRETNGALRTRVNTVLALALDQVQNGVAPTPSAVGRRLTEWSWNNNEPGNGRMDTAPPDTTWPFEEPTVKYARELVRRTLEPRSSTLVARYLLADRWAANRVFLVELLGYLDQFVGLRPTGAAGALDEDNDLPLSFAKSVSAMTGVLVLADGTTSNAACVEQLAVWHNGAWLGSRSTDAGDDFDTAYDTASKKAAESAEPATPGLYNGRIPVLRRVEVRQHTGSDGAVFVLATDETDYLTTDNDLTLRCKKLAPAKRDPTMTRFALTRNGDLAGARQVTGVRGAMVNGKVALVSMTPQHGNLLALMQRSNRVSNARNALAQSSGGVIELAVPGDVRDGDPFGGVDILRGIRREIGEELGLLPNDYVLEANCVFAANNRPRPRDTADVGNGELVTTVLAVGRTALSPEEFKSRFFRASPSKGRYESTGLLFVPMGDGPEDLAAAIWRGTYERSTLTWTGVPGDGVEPRTGSTRVIDYLEQSGLVAALYASATIFGPAPTVTAFRNEMAGRPWWTMPWRDVPISSKPSAAGGSLARVCRPPRELLVPSTDFDTWVDKLFPAVQANQPHLDFDPAAVR